MTEHSMPRAEYELSLITKDIDAGRWLEAAEKADTIAERLRYDSNRTMRAFAKLLKDTARAARKLVVMAKNAREAGI